VRIAHKYIVCVFGCIPLIRMSSRKRRRRAGTYWSGIETSYRQIEKAPTGASVHKITAFQSARINRNKRQFHESGFVLSA
jgi:hypothetical protein